MPQAKKTATNKKTQTSNRTESEGTETMTANEMIEQLTDPRALIEAQRKAVLATFDTVTRTQQETRKLVEDSWKHSFGEIDAWMKPMRQAGEEMTAAGFDLNHRALEVTRGEVERWYDSVIPG